MHSNSSGGRLERFFAGKGFYIVLFLCAAVIGISSWMLAAGNKTMESNAITNSTVMDNKRIETVIITPAPAPEIAPVMSENMIEASAESEEAEEEAVTVWNEEPVYEEPAPVWPVMGEIDRGYDTETLHYDATMRDWRTHSGIDICAAMGEEVVAARSGTVESIETDELYGVVLTLNHGDGSYSIYASLSPETAVSVGDWVEPGSTLGYVGGTAICETAQTSHLHYAVIDGGEYADPMYYLP